MNIDSKEKIAGFPIIDVRDFLRSKSGMFDESFVVFRLKTSLPKARKLIQELVRLNYLECIPMKTGQNYWEQTMGGRALALSSAAKPISRATAENKLAEFLSRVHKVRDSDYYLFQVKRVYVFGSFLDKKDKISDLDLAIELSPKPFPGKDFDALVQNRIEEVYTAGKRFSSILEQAIFPQHEVWQFLKSRSRSLSLHPYMAEMEKHAEHKLIYSDE